MNLWATSEAFFKGEGTFHTDQDCPTIRNVRLECATAPNDFEFDGDYRICKRCKT